MLARELNMMISEGELSNKNNLPRKRNCVSPIGFAALKK